MDENLIDLKYVHWGYMHCCQTVSNKRKAKKLHWNTFWVELSGTVLRLYKDCSLPPDCAFDNVPRVDLSPSKENLITVAFLDVRCSSVKILSIKKKSTDTYRRHIFTLRLFETNSQYVFQAYSLSSMLVWVAKIQESIDACKENISFLADEKMKLVKYIMEKKCEQINFPVEGTTTCQADSIKEDISPLPKRKNQKLALLKKSLSDRKELAVQFDQQMIDFFGNKGAFNRDEFVCQIKKDYYLISGRRDTLIPAHTNVTVFGQLRNRRWRCFVERNDILSSLENLLRDLKDEEDNEFDVIMKKINNIPDYPLIGSLPNSVLNFVKCSISRDNNNNSEEFSCSDDCHELNLTSSLNKCSNSFLENSNTGIVHSISMFSNDLSVDNAINDCVSVAEVFLPNMNNDLEQLTNSDMQRLAIYDSERLTSKNSERLTSNDSERLTSNDLERLTSNDSDRLCSDDVETSSIIDLALTDSLSETSDYESNTENSSCIGSFIDASSGSFIYSSSSSFIDASDLCSDTDSNSEKLFSEKDIFITKKLKRRGIRISVGSSSSDDEDIDQTKELSKRTYITNKKC